MFTNANGNRKRETEWFNVVTSGKLAELCRRFLQKGRRIYAEGRLHSRMSESQEGQGHYYVEVVANRILFLDRQIVQSPSKDGQENGIEHMCCQSAKWDTY
jgi:single-strand DNA-binding protein